MKKSLLAVAVAAALPAFAYAQTNVTLSGDLKTGVTQTKYSNGATNNGNHTAMNDGASKFVISGTEDLGGGLKAIFRIDNRFRPDDSGDAWTAGSGATWVGLTGGFGSVRLGKLDTYYIHGLDSHVGRATALQHWSNSILGYVVTTGNNVARNSRLNNIVRWDSPNFGGISGGITWSPGASASNCSTNITLNPQAAACRSFASAGEGTLMGSGPASATGLVNNKGQVWSGNIGYAGGPLSLGAAFYDEKTEGYNAVAAGGYTGQAAWRVWGGYNFGMFTVGLTYDDSKYKFSGSDLKRAAWSIPVTAKVGPGTLLFTYSQAQDAKLSGSKQADTGAKMYVLGYDYPLSKRTSVGVSYAVLNNDANAAYGLFTGVALNNLSAPGAGQDQKQLHVGVRHAF
jgi:predicted porin